MRDATDSDSVAPGRLILAKYLGRRPMVSPFGRAKCRTRSCLGLCRRGRGSRLGRRAARYLSS